MATRNNTAFCARAKLAAERQDREAIAVTKLYRLRGLRSIRLPPTVPFGTVCTASREDHTFPSARSIF
jgi:hypothetical protein